VIVSLDNTEKISEYVTASEAFRSFMKTLDRRALRGADPGRAHGIERPGEIPLVVLRYLLDSNISEPMRHPSPSSATRRRSGQCATAAMVLHELEFGVVVTGIAPKAVLTQYLDQVVGRLTVLPYDLGAARWHA
jgi:hypothetical protein